MTTAYIVEIKINDTVCYMGPGGRIGTIPKFFNNASRVKNLLHASNPGYGNWKFNRQSHKDSVTVIQIRNLQLGLKASSATMMTYDEFITRNFTNSLRIPNNPRAVYMIELAQPDLQLAAKTKPMYVRLARQGRKHKFGHQWNTAGHLRAHITGRLHRLDSQYNGAKVIEIEMDEDGFTPKQVKSYPIIDFYCASMSSREQYNRHHPKAHYTPLPEYT
ncbi:hypothetical protein [Acinetobacter sp.]|uniref:hypothetical protein n=1 Tax=Acinetobacter sp. TaxID=472 RepID=UPI00388FFCF6